MSFTATEITRIQNAKSRIVQELSQAERFIPVELSTWIRANYIVTGGITATALQGIPTKDIDLYPRSSIDQRSINQYLQTNFIDENGRYRYLVKSVNTDYMNSDHNGLLITVNAITLRNNMQLIRLQDADQARINFDFVHCLPWYNWNQLYISRAQFDSIVHKKLQVNNVAVVKTHRVQKFAERGWDVSSV